MLAWDQLLEGCGSGQLLTRLIVVGPKAWISAVTVVGLALLVLGFVLYFATGGSITRALVLGAVLFGFGRWMRTRALRDASSPPSRRGLMGRRNHVQLLPWLAP
jgi:hypothetical protein